MAEQDLDFNIKISDQDEAKTKSNMSAPLAGKDKSSSSELKPGQAPKSDIESTAPQSQRNSTYDLSKASHPIVCFLTVLLKVAAILSFLFLYYAFDNSILIFIIVIVISSIDFWMVKNIAGRLLVGLRWWNDFKEDGTEVWIFESYDQVDRKPNPVDSAFFWTTQLVGCLIWAVLLFFDVFGLKPYWTLVSGTAFVLNGVNFFGFYKCRGEHQRKVKDLTNKGLQAIGNQIISNAFKG